MFISVDLPEPDEPTDEPTRVAPNPGMAGVAKLAEGGGGRHPFDLLIPSNSHDFDSARCLYNVGP